MFCKSYNEFFTLLANATNQAIIGELKEGKKSVSELVEGTRLEQSLVSHSLARMLECKIVEAERKGKQKIYSLNKQTMIPILKIVDEHAKKMCPQCTKGEKR